ncbi:MAG: carboxypeptidase regulatory-like domain-containing protein, partial [Proteobacteria bacterium]|nr:carboxypeptidase regulatory-like domain-containing protein [Pseudomonadota bacterium]
MERRESGVKIIIVMTVFDTIVGTINKICVACLILLILPVFSVCEASVQTDFIWWERKDAGRCVVHRYDDPSRDWKKIRKERKDWRVTMGEPKRLLLRRDHFPSSWKNQEPFDSSMIPGRTQIWVRDPNGQFLPADISGEKKDIAINVPKNIDLNGLYLIGSHSDAGEIDMGLDRGIARVYFYAKAIVWHYRKDGVKGKKSRFFFRNPDRIALEIGPVEAQLEQSPHQEYEMLVLYRGQPLSNARVTILTEGGWQKTLPTDSHGRFRITPLG